MHACNLAIDEARPTGITRRNANFQISKSLKIRKNVASDGDLGWKKWSGVRERIWLNSSLEGEENEPETI